jgi:hypothetical protein
VITSHFSKQESNYRIIGIEMRRFPKNEANKFWVKIHFWFWSLAFYCFKPIR